SFESSLRNLETTYVDSFVLHSPLPTPEALAEVWGAMEALVDSGRARGLGISNCYDLDVLARLHGDARVKPAVVQNRFYPATGYDFEIRRFCRERGIVYQSFWTLTANPDLLASEPIRRPAARLGATSAQVLFRYLHDERVVPLTG